MNFRLPMALCGAASLLALAAPAFAQQRAFDVPAGPAVRSIPEFARQAGLQITAPSEALLNSSTPPIKGSFDARAALRRLIAGSGLEVASDDGQIIVLRARRPAPARPKAPVAIAPAKAAASDGGSLEEVVVTAQKRAQDAQTVPIAMTTLSAQAIQDFRIRSLEDVSRLTPGLLVSNISPGSPQIAIRGATNTFSQVGVNKPVGVAVDDVFITRNSAATFELFDLDSIQVLKGPQGTLFGRNVSGGVIVINTRNPAFSGFGGAAQAEVGNYNEKRFDAFVNLPLAPNAAVSLSGSEHDHDGYGHDRLDGQQEDDLHSSNLRAKLRVDPAQDLDVLLSADYAHDHNGGRTLSSRSFGDDGDDRTSELGYPQSFARTIEGVSARLNWAAPMGQVTSITAYRWSESGDQESGTGASWRFLPASVAQGVSDVTDNIGDFSQEIRYASPKWDRGDFIAGVYFLDEDASSNTLNQNLAGQTGVISANTRNLDHAGTTSYAVFTDGTLHLLPSLDLTAGVRYTVDDKNATRTGLNYLTPSANIVLPTASGSWGKATPRVVLTWKPAKDVNLYASLSQGFTSGGFNADAVSAAALHTSFKPETVTNYEAGIKSEWLDHRLRFNASLFYMDYKDKQESVANILTQVVTIYNAASATSKGFDGEVQYRLLDSVTLSANYGTIFTRYTGFNIPSTVNYDGNLLGSAPKRKYSLAADLDRPIGGLGYLLGSVSYAYTGHYNTGATNDPNLFVPSYALTNLSLGYGAPDRRWRVVGWVKNAGNVSYVMTPSSRPPVLAVYLGEPRTYGVTLSAKF